jgi:hypothetical protein
MAEEAQDNVLSEEHRRMIAEAIATLHRYPAKPTLKDGQPQYENGDTVRAIQHARSKRTH